MKRTLVLAATVAVFGAMSWSAPSHAATPDEHAVELIKHSVQAVQSADLDHHVTQLMGHAKGVFIVPSYKEGSLVVGASGGDGLLLVRENHTWSDPAFYSIGSLSVGAQAGGKSGAVIMLLMSNRAVHTFAEARNLSLNGKAGLTIGSYSSNVKLGTHKDVVVWSNAKGVEGGAAVSGTRISQDAKLDRVYYSKKVTTAEILNGKANNLSADKLRNALPG